MPFLHIHRVATKSKITLTSPDPAVPTDNSQNSVFSNSDTVEYIPKYVKPNQTIRLGTVEEVTLPMGNQRDEL